MPFVYQCDGCYKVIETPQILTARNLYHDTHDNGGDCDGKFQACGLTCGDTIINMLVKAGDNILLDLPSPYPDNIVWLATCLDYAKKYLTGEPVE